MQQPQSKTAPLFWVITAFAIVYIVWGSTYFFIQSAERGLPPFLLGALRFSASGLLLLAWCAITKKKLFVRSQIFHAFITGNLLLFIANGSLIWSEEILPSSFVAVLTSATPLWIILLDRKNKKENFANRKIVIGVATGFTGVILLFAERTLSSVSTVSQSLLIINLIVVIVGNICWAAGSLYSKDHSYNGDIMVSAAWQMIAAAISFYILTFFSGELKTFNWQSVQLNAWLSVIYLFTMGSLAGYSAYIWLLKVRPATQVTTNAYVNPVVAVLLGAFFGGEKITGIQILALAVILASVFIINSDKYKRILK